MKIHLQTERLILREISDQDLDGIYQLDSDPQVHEYLGKKPIRTLVEAKDVVEYIHQQREKHGLGRWIIEEKTSGRFVGWAGLKYEDQVRKDAPYFDIGYRLIKDFWGKGYASEAAIASVKHGFLNLQLPEIHGGEHINNIASNKILLKTGLNFIETFEYDGAQHHWYGITREDWMSKQVNI